MWYLFYIILFPTTQAQHKWILVIYYCSSLQTLSNSVRFLTSRLCVLWLCTSQSLLLKTSPKYHATTTMLQGKGRIPS